MNARAHPRSRGENTTAALIGALTPGSSPLTRGKPLAARTRAGLERLIPAHAGKTAADPRHAHRRQAHPRSRGENPRRTAASAEPNGSSPLTRGKRSLASTAAQNSGLIPAHAGKTGSHRLRRSPKAAHPRSRGENTAADAEELRAWGSSPLTRGKLSHVRVGHLAVRLIPAHAGKTRLISMRWGHCWAHPRSRGENLSVIHFFPVEVGSSPLTRGKPGGWWSDAHCLGLIPAHAGKTSSPLSSPLSSPAHPRSRGENTSRPALLLRRSIRSWKPLSLPSPLEVTQFGSLAQLTRRRIRFGVLASSFRVVGAHHECESIEVNGLPGIAPRQEGESLLVARTKDHDSPTRFHVLSDDVPQALAYTGAERPHEDPRGNLHEPPRHVTSQPLGHRGQDQDDHQESLSS